MKRADYTNKCPTLLKHLMEQEILIKQQVDETVGLTIWELLKLRSSQINQCAYCIAMHTKQAQQHGESTNRIIGLSAWRDMTFYNSKERLALELCEKLTQSNSIDDDFYSKLANQFDDQSIVTLTIAINAINSWNRIVKMFKPHVEFND